MRNPLLDQKYSDYDELEGPTRLIVPFIACGDLNVAPDADKTYPLEIDGREYRSCAPVASPISPPYERAKLIKQNNLLGKQIDDTSLTHTANNNSTTTITGPSTAAPVVVVSADLIASSDNTAASNSTTTNNHSNELNQRLSTFQNEENNSKLSDLTISN